MPSRPPVRSSSSSRWWAPTARSSAESRTAPPSEDSIPAIRYFSDVNKAALNARTRCTAFRFTKVVGAASPRLVAALASGETLRSVHFDFVRSNDSVFQEVDLAGVRISKVEQAVAPPDDLCRLGAPGGGDAGADRYGDRHADRQSPECRRLARSVHRQHVHLQELRASLRSGRGDRASAEQGDLLSRLGRMVGGRLRQPGARRPPRTGHRRRPPRTDGSPHASVPRPSPPAMMRLARGAAVAVVLAAASASAAAVLVVASGIEHHSREVSIEIGLRRVGEVLFGCLVGLAVSWLLSKIWPLPAAAHPEGSRSAMIGSRRRVAPELRNGRRRCGTRSKLIVVESTRRPAAGVANGREHPEICSR